MGFNWYSIPVYTGKNLENDDYLSQWPSGLNFFRPAVSGWDPRLLGLVSSSRCILDKPWAAVPRACNIEVMTKSVTTSAINELMYKY